MRTIQLTLEYTAPTMSDGRFRRTVDPSRASSRSPRGAPQSGAGQGDGAGRTDSGVHAVGQVATFSDESAAPLKAFVLGLNSLLPKDIAVRAASERPEGFDARRSARGKLYRYPRGEPAVRTPLAQRYAWSSTRALDEGAMARAARSLLGRQDFSAFRASDCEAPHAGAGAAEALGGPRRR